MLQEKRDISSKQATLSTLAKALLGFIFFKKTSAFNLFTILTLSLPAQAEEYHWPYAGYKGKTLDATCRHIAALHPEWLTNKNYIRIYTHSYIDYYGYCVSSVINAQGETPGLGMARLTRLGTYCKEGTSNNKTTGSCANDPEKGAPSRCPVSATGGGNAPSHQGPIPVAGNPINFSIGNKYQEELDYAGNSLIFSRAYNSLDGLWRHNYSTYLRLAGKYLALVMADGRESFFELRGSTVITSPTELGVLAQVAGTWLYTAQNNDTYNFDTSGRLIRWTNAAGAQHFLTHSNITGSRNTTITVTDSLDQSLSFTEDALHQPLTLNTAALTIKYDYNANQRLSKLTRTRGGQTEQRLFHYEDARNNALLTGITDERGVRFATWTFDELGRATSSEHAGGIKRTEVAYNADGSSTVTNEFGKKSTYRFVTIDGVKRVSAIEGKALGSCPMSNSTFTYDARGLLKTKIDNKGNLTTYNYNARGLEISRTEASGTPQARSITTEWHPTLFLPTVVTEPNQITHYQYDDQGRQLSRTVDAL